MKEQWTHAHSPQWAMNRSLSCIALCWNVQYVGCFFFSLPLASFHSLFLPLKSPGLVRPLFRVCLAPKAMLLNRSITQFICATGITVHKLWLRVHTVLCLQGHFRSPKNWAFLQMHHYQREIWHITRLDSTTFKNGSISLPLITKWFQPRWRLSSLLFHSFQLNQTDKRFDPFFF